MTLIVVKHPVRPEYADGWPRIVESFTNATRAEPGNICFDWYRSSDDPTVWLLVEAFVDGDAGRVHVESEHLQAAIVRLPHVLRDCPRDHPRRCAGEWLVADERDQGRARRAVTGGPEMGGDPFISSEEQ